METKTGGIVLDDVLESITWLADQSPGTIQLLNANETVPIRWATSPRLVQRLRAEALSNIPSDIEVTLWRNNVATSLTLTVPAGSVIGDKFIAVGAINLANGDDWAIRLTGQPNAEGPSTELISATIEWQTSGGSGGGGVQSVVAGEEIAVDNTDPENPIVSFDPSDTVGRLNRKSAMVLGLDDFAYSFDDLFMNLLPGWSVSAGIVNNTATGPGVFRFPNVNFSLLQRTQILVADAAVTPWHIAGRVKFLSAIAATDRQGLCVGTGAFTNLIELGRNHTVSATHFFFGVRKANVLTSAVSTVPLDITTFHEIEIWFDGTDVWGAVDGETPVHVAVAANCPTNPPALFDLHGVIVTGTVGGNAMDLDYVYTAFGRTP
jgi:hypothetical protein